jgi:hypothetical protein
MKTPNQQPQKLSQKLPPENAKLKASIIAKFDTLARFCEITGRNLQELNTRLLRSTERSRLYLAAVATDVVQRCNQPKPGLITAIQREKIRAALGRYSSITEFCTQHAAGAFTSVYVSRILGGRTKSITPKVEKLAAELGVTLTDSENAK